MYVEIVFIALFGGLIIGLVASGVFRTFRETYDITETVEIKYLDADIEPIEKIDVGDWFDLRAAEDVVLYSGEYKPIPLGVAMKLPDGYEAHMIPRSGTFGKHGIIMANSVGLIDESYKGDNDEWHFPAYAVRGCRILKNERICQFRIVRKQPPVVFKPVESLGNKSRGGMGSTGRM